MVSDQHATGQGSSFRRRLILIFSGFTLCITVAFTVINLYTTVQATKARAAEKAQLLATHLAATARLPLFADDRITLQQLAKELAANGDVAAVTITDHRGVVLATAGNPAAAEVGDAFTHELPVQLQKNAQGAEQALGFSPTEHAPLGTVKVTMDRDVLRTVINRQIASACFTALLVWFAFTQLSVLIVRWINRALAPLIDGLRTIQSGDFSVRVAASRHQELMAATTAVNELAAGLQRRDEENRRLQQELLDAMKHEVREERRQLMAKLIQTNRMTSLGLLVSSMAHEMNTPNAAIRLASQQMARVWDDAVPLLDRVAGEEGDFSLGGLEYSLARKEVGKGLEIIRRSSERINQVINDLRDYSLGEQQPLTERISLNQVVTDALAIVMAHGKQGQVRIDRELHPDLPAVVGNRYHLGQVLTNLMLNGIQATPKGQPGRLVVATDYDPARKVVTLSVQDHGEGIDDAIRNHVREPFFSTRIDAGGSGLGLYIADYIVANHRGTMEFDSAPGAGTTVTVSLPAEY
jgi:signal transduction histidine kinase